MNRRKLLIANNPLLSGPTYEEREKGGIPYRVVAIDAIDRDPNQPRINFDEERLEELAQSIRTYGVLSPLLVRPVQSSPGRFLLIAGERRLRASKLAGLPTIPVLVEQNEDSNDERTLAMQLVENLQRTDLSPLERAHAIGALKDAHSLSVRDVADRLGISKSMVQRSLDILELPDDLLNALREGASESKVLLLSKIPEKEVRARYLQDIELVSRAELQEKLVGSRDKPRIVKPVEVTPEDARLMDEIQRAVGTKVKIIRNADSESGRLVIDFYSSDDLREVFRKLVAE